MSDNSSRGSDSLLSRRIRQMVRVDPGAPALFFEGQAFPWSFYAHAVADLAALLAAHSSAQRVGIVLRNRPGPLAALIATLGTGRVVVPLSPHLGDIGLEKDIIDLAPDVIVAEDGDWAREAILASSQTAGAIALRTGGTGSETTRRAALPAPGRPRSAARSRRPSGTTPGWPRGPSPRPRPR